MFFRKPWSKKKVIAIVLVVAGCASLFAFIAYSVTAYFFALSINNPQAVQKVFEGARLKSPQESIYETKWKAENYFSDPKIIELCRAIEKQDVEEMQRIIDSGADVNAKGKDNMPILLWAYPAGEQGMECLLKNGADPNVILESSYEGRSDVITPGSVLLHTAIMSSLGGDAKFENYVDLLLKYGADPDLGKPAPLPTAVYFCSNPNAYRVCYRLIDAGADVNLSEEGNFPPVVRSIVCMSYDLAFYLLEHGASYDVNTPQGAKLQRFLYNLTIKYPEKINSYSEKDREQVEKIIAWLEERGVSFDEPAPEPESLEKP